MFRTVMWRKRLLFVACSLGIALALVLALMPLLKAASAQTRLTDPAPVKVLIITLFPPERDAWLQHGYWIVASHPRGSIHMPPNNADADGTVWCRTNSPTSTMCNGDGVYLTMTGPEKVNAATSMMAVLRDPTLSFHGAYFLITGTAATSPFSQGTLGFVAWARWIVDRDQGTHVIPRTSPDYPFGYQPPNTSYADNTADFQLDATLVQQAYNATSGLMLQDSPKAQAERALYPPPQPSLKPFVAMCDTTTSDSYLVGSELSDQTKYITGTITDTMRPGNYCTMENEDSAVAGVLKRFSLNISGSPNYLKCTLDLRAASTFDQPSPSQTIESFLSQRFRVNDLALDNLITVAMPEINALQMRPACSFD